MLNSTEHEISLGHNKYSAELSMKEILKNCKYFKIYKQNKFHAQLCWAWKKFHNLGP